ncbi:MAG TPA: hypothetical protein ENN34_03370 [Deltaproteobacteria bacterium]|nr:hypothetical protein [Deltaproteobacteria bacterium]
MCKGVSLVELLLAVAAASMLILALYSLNSITERSHHELMDSWYCTQSLRTAFVELNRDLIQCGYLLPEDLKIAVSANNLFIAGTPRTSQHSGLCLSPSGTPPYFSIIRGRESLTILLDTVDIDHDDTSDYWADLGIITESGPFVIAHNYSRGNSAVKITSEAPLEIDDRVVPAIHYALRPGGLYRNGQLIAEAIVGIESHLGGDELIIDLEAEHNGTNKKIRLTHIFR